ncbi:MAG: GntR family transcriptional regulator [Sulfuritalea sp.]|jgi:GntR family transcriptional regulator of vanillate catabolism|nr:GntR family transcriptional regulator [Sulfuritalea sp.]
MEENSGQTQTLKAVLGLRGLIIDGKLAPGERVSETLLVNQFGVSRTPARIALMKLKEEGLLDSLPTGGFIVSSFSQRDVADAIDIRGTLEGMAARLAAERGGATEIVEAMAQCVKKLDDGIAALDESQDLAAFVELNDQFHELLIEASQSTMLRRSMERVSTLPFAAPNAFVKSSRSGTDQVKTILVISNEQHRSIVQAIRNREGTRAQAIAIEHSRSAWKYLEIMFSGQPLQALRGVPGLSMVR